MHEPMIVHVGERVMGRESRHVRSLSRSHASTPNGALLSYGIHGPSKPRKLHSNTTHAPRAQGARDPLARKHRCAGRGKGARSYSVM